MLTNHFVMSLFFVIMEIIIPKVLCCVRSELSFVSSKPHEVNLRIMHNFKLFPHRNSISISRYGFCENVNLLYVKVQA